MKHNVRKALLARLPEAAAYAEIIGVTRDDSHVKAQVLWRTRSYGPTAGMVELDVTDIARNIAVGDRVHRRGEYANNGDSDNGY